MQDAFALDLKHCGCTPDIQPLYNTIMNFIAVSFILIGLFQQGRSIKEPSSGNSLINSLIHKDSIFMEPNPSETTQNINFPTDLPPPFEYQSQPEMGLLPPNKAKKTDIKPNESSVRRAGTPENTFSLPGANRKVVHEWLSRNTLENLQQKASGDVSGTSGTAGALSTSIKGLFNDNFGSVPLENAGSYSPQGPKDPNAYEMENAHMLGFPPESFVENPNPNNAESTGTSSFSGLENIGGKPARSSIAESTKAFNEFKFNIEKEKHAALDVAFGNSKPQAPPAKHQPSANFNARKPDLLPYGGPTGCEFRAHINRDGYLITYLYEERSVNGEWIARPCAPGTGFNETTCYCSDVLQVPVKEYVYDHQLHTQSTKICEPEVYVNFTNGVVDLSGNNNSIDALTGNKHAFNFPLVKGSGYFDGTTRLLIWKYQSYDFMTHLDISFRFKARPPISRNAAFPLVSNCEKYADPSYEIILYPDARNITFYVKTKYDQQYISLPVNPYQWNDVRYRYENGTLWASVDGTVRSKEVYGPIEKKIAGMTFGHCERFGNFIGYIKEIYVYGSCLPPLSTEMKAYQENKFFIDGKK